MGLAVTTVEAIVREHVYKPIRGDVFAIGRQTMFFSPQDAYNIIVGCGAPWPEGVKVSDLATENRTIQTSDTSNNIRDDAFFGLLGINNLRNVDHSAYEQAEIIHDLTIPIPESMEGIADFIIDGSTLDNVFDPSTAIKNLARMLCPGGRLFSINMGSNHYGPYTILTAPWVFDYFVINGFFDCKAYMFVSKPTGEYNIFKIDLDHFYPGGPHLPNFTAPSTDWVMGIYFIAEKREGATWEKNPIQQFYQEQEMKDVFLKNIQRMKQETSRSDIFFSSAPPFLDAPLGYKYVAR